VVLTLAAVAAITLVASPVARAAAAVSGRDGITPTPIILDTDMYSDFDAGGAEVALLAGALMGKDNVIAMGLNSRFNIPAVSTDSWRCVAAIAQFYGYPNIPIASDVPDDGPDPATNNFIGPCGALASPTTPAPQGVVQTYRQALVSQPDGSVVIVETGYEENLQALLDSPPDSISPLDGSQLIAQKVKELVIMGGGYPSSTGENNFEGNAGAARAVTANWPTKIVYSGYEVGSNVFTGANVTVDQPASSPVRAGMLAYAGPQHVITSFDITAAFHALNPTDPSMTEVGPGTNAIDIFGANTFTAGTGDEYYLQLNDATSLETSIDALWDTLPGTTPQGLAFSSTPPSSPLLGQTYAASATPGVTGNPVTLTIDPTSTSGCTIDPSGLVTFAEPAGSCVVDANEPGTLIYAPGAVQQTLDVSQVPQVVTFTSTAPSEPIVGATYPATAAGGASGNPVTYSIDSSSTSGCTVDPTGLVTFSAPFGTCVLDADQAGTSIYASAPRAEQTIDVVGDPQTITFTSTPPAAATVGSAYHAHAKGGGSPSPVVLSIDASSTSGCTISSSGVVTFSAPIGTCVLDANQAGSSAYAAAPQVQQTIGVGGDAQTITFTSTPPKGTTVGSGPYTPTATASSGLHVTIALDATSTGCTLTGGLVRFVAVGTCVIDATQAGDGTFVPAASQEQIAIGQGQSVITVTTRPPLHPRVGQAYRPTATSSSGDAVTVSLGARSTGCTADAGSVQFRDAGTCVIVFSDAGNANWMAAPPARQTVHIGRAAVRLLATASPSVVAAGSTIRLGATVSVPTATGTVTFETGSTVLCTAALRAGVATCRATTGGLTKGMHAIVVTYSGSAAYEAARARTAIRVS